VPRIVYTDISGQERSVPFGADHPIVTIGRGTDCTIRSNRKSVSRRHAEFRFTNGQFEVIDLDSSNGTFLIINDERTPIHGRQFLAPNDEVWCGDFILHFIDEEDSNTAATADPFGGIRDSYAQSPVDMDFGVVDSLAWGGTQPPLPMNGPDHTQERSSELERLLAEKRSIEDLAARQANELEELQRRLDDTKRMAEQQRDPDNTSMVPPLMSGEVEQLRDKIARLQDEADELEAEARLSRTEVQRLNDELEGIRDEKRKLEEKLHTALQSSSRSGEAESRLDDAKRRISSLESELEGSIRRVAELEAHLNDNADALVTQQKLHEDLLARNRDIEALEGEIERLQGESRGLYSALEEARSNHESGQKALDETDALRRELERHRRLVEEFERRNRDLQSEVDELRIARRNELSRVAELENRASELEDELGSARETAVHLGKEREALQEELDALRAEGSVDDLRREVEGLKQRLRLEKERTRHDEHLAKEFEIAQAELVELRQKNEELEGENQVLKEQILVEPSTVSIEGVPPELLRQLMDRVDSLERIVDAIERTNLDALSTVDRVRLQSAIRETEPKKSLTHLKALLGGSAQGDE